MSRDLRNLSERRILKAVAEGKLQGLKGVGKPLPYRPGDAFVDPGLAAGHRIMAEAGVVPEEFRLKEALQAAREVWQAAPDAAARKAAMQRVAELQTKYEMAREARRKFMSG